MPLTREQVNALRRLPLGRGQHNKLRLVLALSETKQTDVCKALGVTKPWLSEIVNGRYETLSLVQAERLAHFFGVRVDDLFPGHQAPVRLKRIA